MVTFSLFNVVFALEALDERASAFSAQLLRNGTLIKTTFLSILATILATEVRFFQSLLDTTSLSLGQWAACLLVACSVVVVAEAWKFVLRRRPERRPSTTESQLAGVPRRPTKTVASGG